MEFPKLEQIVHWMKRVLPVLLGAAGGYAYYYYIGCLSGACPITSNPWISTAYGGVIGFLLTPKKRKPVPTPSEQVGNIDQNERST